MDVLFTLAVPVRVEDDNAEEEEVVPGRSLIEDTCTLRENKVRDIGIGWKLGIWEAGAIARGRKDMVWMMLHLELMILGALAMRFGVALRDVDDDNERCRPNKDRYGRRKAS